MNELLFLLQVLTILCATVIALKIGKEALIAVISILFIFGNLFVLKQIHLFGFHPTATDAFPVGAMIGLNLLQEYFGEKLAKKTIWICFFCLILYVILTQIHMFYIPSIYDLSTVHYNALFKSMPRISATSIAVTLSILHLNRIVYSFLQKKFKHKYLLPRFFISLLIMQFLDTILFAFIALYGVVSNLRDIIIVSTLVKVATGILSVPFVALVKSMNLKIAKE